MVDVTTAGPTCSSTCNVVSASFNSHDAFLLLRDGVLDEATLNNALQGSNMNLVIGDEEEFTVELDPSYCNAELLEARFEIRGNNTCVFFWKVLKVW